MNDFPRERKTIIIMSNRHLRSRQTNYRFFTKNTIKNTILELPKYNLFKPYLPLYILIFAAVNRAYDAIEEPVERRLRPSIVHMTR